MINFIEFIIIIITIIIIYKYVEKQTYDVVYVKSTINNKDYLVRNLPDKQEAANLIANMSIKLEKLVDYVASSNINDLYDDYISDELHAELYTNIKPGESSNQIEDEETIELVRKLFKSDIERLVNNFNPDKFSENTPDSKYTSYSVNKGEKIVFCIRDKDENDTLVQENIMMFVSIHELAHLMTKSVGHGPEFWTNFKILLKIAIDMKLYSHMDFNKKPEKYCGTKISDTPLKITN